jgi:hypothetical protein
VNDADVNAVDRALQADVEWLQSVLESIQASERETLGLLERLNLEEIDRLNEIRDRL